MKVLVVGTGAREHALLWKFAASPRVTECIAAHGNAGFEDLATTVEFDPFDPEAVARIARTHAVDLVAIGPEDALAAGMADVLRAQRIPVLGASRDAARLEWGRTWAKDLMRDAGVPQAHYESFRDATAANRYVSQAHYPLVIKADGLARGKGSFICTTGSEAARVIDEVMVRGALGRAGATIVVEDFIEGPEFSYQFFTDGVSIRRTPTSQDHKHIGDGDIGPMTGGMGAYTPVFPAHANTDQRFDAALAQPLLRELQRRSVEFRGVICINARLSADGPRVMEANARFGSPEAELVLPMLHTDLVDVVEAMESQRLGSLDLSWQPGAALTVVIAARGYPASPETGATIRGLDDSVPHTLVFHGGTRIQGDQVVTNGGRVLTVSGYGRSMEVARAATYARVDQITFDGMQHRRDLAAPSRLGAVTQSLGLA